MTPWEMFLWGYEAGVRSGHALGVAEGDAALVEAALGFLQERGPFRPDPRRPELPPDPTTGPELIARAKASWGPEQVPTSEVSGHDARPNLRRSA